MNTDKRGQSDSGPADRDKGTKRCVCVPVTGRINCGRPTISLSLYLSDKQFLDSYPFVMAIFITNQPLPHLLLQKYYGEPTIQERRVRSR